MPSQALIALAGVIVMNIAASVLIKMDANAGTTEHRLFGLFGWPIVAGLVCYAVALILYAWSLRSIELHVAQIVVSLQFAGIILASALIFREAIGLQQWLGITLIFAGILIAVR